MSFNGRVEHSGKEDDPFLVRDDTSEEEDFVDAIEAAIRKQEQNEPVNHNTTGHTQTEGGAPIFQGPTLTVGFQVVPTERTDTSSVVSTQAKRSIAFRDHVTLVKSVASGALGATSDADARELAQAYSNTPIFTSAASNLIEATLPVEIASTDLMPQYGLLGLKETDIESQSIGEQALYDPEEDRLVYANLNVPWSAFICGSQGAGKSHTLSCLLESALVAGNSAGELPNPLTGLVLHYDNYTSAASTQLCEAAYLCSSGIPVTILVSPANIWNMTKLYSELPGLAPGSPKPKVRPLYLTENQLDIAKILKLMAVDPVGDSVPLYMEVVMNILREMAMEGAHKGAFSYADFRRRVDDTRWVKGQAGPLNMRLQLLESFLKPSVLTRTTRPAPAEEDIWKFEPGMLTVVDLSDPFVNRNDACSLFTICLSLFLEDRSKCGRVVALDEAHKFLLQSGEAQVLTDNLTSIIRQQRHTGTRVVIATQEPTLAPELIDLANVTFVHRFLSPAWYEVLKQHLAGAKKQNSVEKDFLFETIVNLKTGEALLFCPTALTVVEPDDTGIQVAKPLGNGYVKVRIRDRLTADGGKSILASDSNGTLSGQRSINVPMHIVANRPPIERTSRVPPPRPASMQTNVASFTRSQAPPNNVMNRLEEELVRLTRARFESGHRIYAQLKKSYKQSTYRKVEKVCGLKTGDITLWAPKSQWETLHRNTIAACRAEANMPPE